MIARFFIKTVIYAAGIMSATYLLTGVKVASFTDALIVAVVIIVLNSTIKPFLKLITLPITLLTFGLFSFILNGAMILLTDWLVDGLQVDGIWTAVLFSLILSIFISIVDHFTEDSGKRRD